MFKLNRMTEYAILVLDGLAHRQDKILTTAQLAELTGLNHPTVAKVAKTLVVANMLDTQRGVHGGYRLARQASIISLLQLVEAMDRPIVVNYCVDGEQESNVSNNCCFVSQNWNRVKLAIRNALDDVSLKDLIDPAQLFGPAEQLQAKGHEAPSSLQSEMLS